MVNTNVLRLVAGSSNQVWVSPRSDWGRKVRKTWSLKDSLHTPRKEEAIKNAVSIAKRQKGEMFVQDKSWKIVQRNSYWSDPFPPRDKK